MIGQITWCFKASEKEEKNVEEEEFIVSKDARNKKVKKN